MNDVPPPHDRDAVLALLAAVKYLKDDEDVAGFAACWSREAQLLITSNGVDRPLLNGREAIMAFYRHVWETGGHGLGSERETHVAEHPYIVTLGAGRLLARHCASFFNWRDGCPNLVGFGEFRDEIIHEEGAWRITVRHSRLWRQTRAPA